MSELINQLQEPIEVDATNKVIPVELKKEALAVSIDALRFAYVEEMNAPTRHFLGCPEEFASEALKELRQRVERFHIAVACLHLVSASIQSEQPSGE